MNDKPITPYKPIGRKCACTIFFIIEIARERERVRNVHKNCSLFHGRQKRKVSSVNNVKINVAVCRLINKLSKFHLNFVLIHYWTMQGFNKNVSNVIQIKIYCHTANSVNLSEPYFATFSPIWGDV